MHVIATGDPMRGRPSDLQAQQKPTKKTLTQRGNRASLLLLGQLKAQMG